MSHLNITSAPLASPMLDDKAFEQMSHDYDVLRASSEDMAHEIMEACQTLHGYVQAHYTSSLRGNSGFETSAMAALTLEASQRLIDLVARHQHRIEGHIEEHDHPRLNINTLIESAVAMMRPRFNGIGQTISIMAVGEPLFAEVDESLFYQTMINLLSAAHHSPRRCALLEVLLCDGLEEIKILFVDHGRLECPYLTQEDECDMYVREERDLALAEKAVLAHNGSLHIQRTEEWGRVITVQIPKIQRAVKLF
jgi:K+-sensing histidine kinase KdpD